MPLFILLQLYQGRQSVRTPDFLRTVRIPRKRVQDVFTCKTAPSRSHGLWTGKTAESGHSGHFRLVLEHKSALPQRGEEKAKGRDCWLRRLEGVEDEGRTDLLHLNNPTIY